MLSESISCGLALLSKFVCHEKVGRYDKHHRHQGAAMTLEKALAAFENAMLGKNRSTATLRAYRTDVLQFMLSQGEQCGYYCGGRCGEGRCLGVLAALARKGLTGLREPARSQRSGILSLP